MRLIDDIGWMISQLSKRKEYLDRMIRFTDLQAAVVSSEIFNLSNFNPVHGKFVKREKFDVSLGAPGLAIRSHLRRKQPNERAASFTFSTTRARFARSRTIPPPPTSSGPLQTAA